MFRIDPRYIGVEAARRRELLAREIDAAWDDWAEFKRAVCAQQFEFKGDGESRDDRGRFSFGKKPKPEPELVSQPAAMRPCGPRPPATPAQQARLAIVNARAREAVSRVQQLDPNWRAPQSLTSSDNRDDAEVMIRAKEAETREAEARYIALARAGHDDSYMRRDAPTTAEVLAPRGELVGDRSRYGEKVRIVAPDEFENIRAELMGGARRVEPAARYDGVWYKREDGSIFGLRLNRDHGLTLDVIENTRSFIPNGFRIHQR
jgi:hypothetical protein